MGKRIGQERLGTLRRDGLGRTARYGMMAAMSALACSGRTRSVQPAPRDDVEGGGGQGGSAMTPTDSGGTVPAGSASASAGSATGGRASSRPPGRAHPATCAEAAEGAGGCVSDADCVPGTICVCDGRSDLGECVPSNCVTDADCGAGLHCAYYVDPCSRSGLAYACQRAEDRCDSMFDCDGLICGVRPGAAHRECLPDCRSTQ